MNAKLRIEEMTPGELAAAIARRPIIYAPCGLIEWHGRHLPLGLDGLKIYHILLGCAERTRGVVLPVNWIGAPGFGSFCGTLNYPPELVQALIRHVLGQSAKLGARVIALVTGHYGKVQVNAVKGAAEEFAAEHPNVRILACAEYKDVTVDGQSPSDHAGKWETSMALALFPHLTQMEAHRPGEEPIPRYADEDASWDAERRPWIWKKDLRETASAALGERAVAAIRDVIVRKIEALCAKAEV